MKTYVVLLIHMIIWSGFSLAIWLSPDDHKEYKLLMLFVFIYISVIVANRFFYSLRRSIVVTVLSFGCYFGIYSFL
jgi:hypothetical protein